MGKYTGAWSNRQMLVDPERFSRHRPPHVPTVEVQAEGWSEVELDTRAPESELDGGVTTDVTIGGVPGHPIDTTPSRGGFDRDPNLVPPTLFGRPALGRSHRVWNRAMSGAGQGVVTRTGYNDDVHSVPVGTDASVQVSGPQQAARGVDHGAGVLSTKVFEPHGPHGQLHHESRPTTLVTGLTTTPMANQGGGYEQLRRGLNADPINDGAATGGVGVAPRPTAWRVGEADGSLWRPARYFRTHVQRIFRVTRQLPTDQTQINPARTPTMIVTTTVPARSSKGGELFASLSKFLPKAVPVGPLPRTPGPWYGPAEAAAVTEDPSGLPDYSGVVHAG